MLLLKQPKCLAKSKPGLQTCHRQSWKRWIASKWGFFSSTTVNYVYYVSIYNFTAACYSQYVFGINCICKISSWIRFCRDSTVSRRFTCSPFKLLASSVFQPSWPWMQLFQTSGHFSPRTSWMCSNHWIPCEAQQWSASILPALGESACTTCTRLDLGMQGICHCLQWRIAFVLIDFILIEFYIPVCSYYTTVLNESSYYTFSYWF